MSFEGFFPKGLHVRLDDVEGVSPWVWVEKDFWGWQRPKEEYPALRDLILTHVRKRGGIIQAGGCCGMYPRLWGNLFDVVYTFEPDPLNFYCLSVNCSSPKIIKTQAALGEHTGTCSIERPVDFNVGMNKIGGPGCIPIIRLDDMTFSPIDVMQLDCEGNELNIIRGAQKTIEKHRPLIAIESPEKELADLLESIGYREAGRAGLNPDVVFAPT